VSEQTAKKMAEKVRTLTRTDYSISTTGNLGPDVLEGKERGLIYIAVSREGQTFTRELKLEGDRWANKIEAALQSLIFLIEVIGNDRKNP
jgi:nicotinamide mononucleotide (NMN) deamidase PncC